MSSAPLSDRLSQAAHALMSALGDHRRGLPLWAVTYLHVAIERLRKGAVDLLRKLEAGTYRPRKPGAPRARQAAAPRAPRPAPAIRFPNYFGIVAELIGNQRPVYGPDLRDLLQDPALPGYVQACPALARRLRPLCRLVGIALPDWLRPPPRPRRRRAKQAPGARARRLPPDPSKPSWLLLRAACRADFIARIWRCGGPPPEAMVHVMRHLLSKEVIDLLKPQFKFLNAMFP